MPLFFDSWAGLFRVIVAGTFSYAALILMLRVSGKRTLSKMNAFDLIVTIALGSTLATVLLSKDVAITEGLVAFALLIGLQWVVAWLSVRSRTWRGLVKSEPRLVLLRGKLLEETMRRERLSAEEVWSAIRSQGLSSVEEVEAVVLETDGRVSVIPTANRTARPTALRNLQDYPSNPE